MVKQIFDKSEKEQIARQILEALPDWFGIPEAREEYIKESGEQLFFAAGEGNHPIGFLCLKETGRETVELSVMGGAEGVSPTGYWAGAIYSSKSMRCRHRISVHAGKNCSDGQV